MLLDSANAIIIAFLSVYQILNHGILDKESKFGICAAKFPNHHVADVFRNVEVAFSRNGFNASLILKVGFDRQVSAVDAAEFAVCHPRRIADDKNVFLFTFFFDLLEIEVKNAAVKKFDFRIWAIAI